MRIFLTAVALCLVGCGPLGRPMVVRLDEEQQRAVGDAWVNMLSPPERLDRILLLDVLLVHEMHQLGVDRLVLTSEKHVGDGLVVMEVRFERCRPSFDEFTVTYFDENGNEARRERYTRDEVEQRWEYLARPVPSEYAADEADPAVRAELEQLRAAKEARIEETRAATRPASAP